MSRVIDFIEPNKDCQLCDHHNDYTCFDCEEIQIKKKYPHSIYNNDCQWEIKQTRKWGIMHIGTMIKASEDLKKLKRKLDNNRKKNIMKNRKDKRKWTIKLLTNY